jgi:DNA repair exonuclease SbcCD nuclease subunit
MTQKTTKTKTTNKPLFVAISDIHFNIQNLNLAAESLSAALFKATELKVPLVIAGDLNDTKAIIRAEVANKMISILENAKTPVFILEGNHDKVNEKSDDHGLNYLKPYAKIIDKVAATKFLPNVLFIPYQNDGEKLTSILERVPEKTILVMHQGVRGAFMGDYVQDKTSIDTELLKDFTVISGHYHRHQTVGTLTYIGSPYTMTFGEANDGPKGFLVVNEDGSFTREILNLRKHTILELNNLNEFNFKNLNPSDLIWIKLSGNSEYLENIKKSDVAKLIGHSNFKLDKIYPEKVKLEKKAELTDGEILDALIDSSQESSEQKKYLKQLWRELV